MKLPRWVWEVRSLNGKSLDFRLRVPPGNDDLQPKVRKLIAKYFSRGNLQINLSIDRQGNQPVPVVNQAALDAVIAAVASIHNQLDCSPPAAAQILGLKGVLETREIEDSQEERDALGTAMMGDFDQLMKELEIARANEGAQIAKSLLNQLQQLENLTSTVTDDRSRTAEQINIRLNNQISALMDNTAGLDLDRLHQEAAILATKADLCEELDRLNAHIQAARKLMAGDIPVGRKLEFLCQEFNRECNTICSKSNATTVTAAGLEMKVVIDQFREQVQNME